MTAPGKQKIVVTLTFTDGQMEALKAKLSELGYPWRMASVIVKLVCDGLEKK